MTAPCIATHAAAPCEASATYSATPEAVPQARALARCLPPEIRDNAEVVTAELVANAVEHADTSTVTVSVGSTAGGGAHIEVSDSDSRHLPHHVPFDQCSTHGRGLAICACLCSDLHCETRPGGKTVCADISCGTTSGGDQE